MKRTFVNLPDADEFFANLEASINPDKSNHPMAKLMAEHTPRKPLALRSIVDGKIIARSSDGFIVSIPGVKFDAHMPFNESMEDAQIGKCVAISVIGVPVGVERGYIVSEKFAADWGEMLDARNEDIVLEVTVAHAMQSGERFKGVRAFHGGVACFIPASQIPHHLQSDKLVGQTIPVKFMPDRRGEQGNGLPVVSFRKGLDTKKEDRVRQFSVGQTVTGTVLSFPESGRGQQFGAIVAMEGDSSCTALLHWTEITDRYARPDKTLSVGQVIELLITGVDLKERTLSVSYKQARRAAVLAGIEIGQELEVTVLRFRENTGYFVAVEDFTALVPCSEISNKRLRAGAHPFKHGDTIKVIVKEKDAATQRLILSHSAAVLAGLKEGEAYDGVVAGLLPDIGVLVSVNQQEGLLHKSELCKRDSLDSFKIGDPIMVVFKEKREVKHEIRLSWSRRALTA